MTKDNNLTILVALLEEKIERKKKEKVTVNNRVQWAKQNETLDESKARRSGFVSGLMVAKEMAESLLAEMTEV